MAESNTTNTGAPTRRLTSEGFENFLRWLSQEDQTISNELNAAEAAAPGPLAPADERRSHLARTAFLAGRKEEIVSVAEQIAKNAEPSEAAVTQSEQAAPLTADAPIV